MSSRNATAESVAATLRSPETQRATPGWRRKANRLPAENYGGPNAYLLTLVTSGRVVRFSNKELVASLVERLRAACRSEGAQLLAYVFMPNHLHLLLQGADRTELPRLMKRFKQESAFDFKRRTGEALWQKSYHDHALRREEDLNDVVRYVAANPVRGGLVSDWTQYPFTGGDLLDGALDGDLKVAATGGVSAGDAPL
ncbi:MAG TPA: transposase [Dehalococcoidia bacterium]|nr:transposase [Dehalococcoidia bacterium]